EVLSISPAQASIDVTSTGYVVPQSVAKVGSNVVGRVVTVNVKEGQAVHAGDVLFELDHKLEDANVGSARAKAFAAGARAKAARAAVEEARIPWERQKKLVEAGAAGSATAEDLKTRVTSLEAQAQATEAEANAAMADAKALETTLSEYTIKSPIDGVVQTKPAQLGDVVGPTGLPLVELVDASSLLVETDVPEARMHLIKDGQPTEVVLESAPQKRLRGAVVEISPRINRSKATATVKVRFVDVPERLAPEMSARVSFLSKELDKDDMAAPPKIIVPKTAVVDRSGAQVVFTVAEGKVRQVFVSLGQEDEGGFVLVDGPPPGTKLVKDPPSTLKDGQSVKEGSS
ncbi:MAG TPA: efflux RND transporter periplasmic adaptor subunit, partial [Polyangiaceae bacterium]|nr:efflux RND transporter periplasmic adaptor subunit [Polyangiaceae bacterium]